MFLVNRSDLYLILYVKFAILKPGSKQEIISDYVALNSFGPSFVALHSFAISNNKRKDWTRKKENYTNTVE